MKEIKVSIVIPVYKSTKSLELLAEQIIELQKRKHLNIEIIFVNDSPSFLETRVILKKLNNQYENVKVLNLRKNQGQQIALLVGINKAIGDFIITMDDDLQHPVSEIPKMIAAIESNPDVDAVFCVPKYLRKNHSVIRKIGSYTLNKIDTFFLRKPKGLIKSSFRIFNRDIAEYIILNRNAMPALSSLIINSTDRIINIDVNHNPRTFGKGNYTNQQLISMVLNNLLHYSSLPLQILGFLGIAALFLSILFIVWILIRKLFMGIDFPGWASTVILISFFGGLNLFAIGIVGEYLNRIIKEQQKPDLNSLIKE
jgi:glycosyltransferase involved in cell wall biosynthesis